MTQRSQLVWEMFHRPYPRYGSILDFSFHSSMYEKHLRLGRVMGIPHTIKAHEKFAEAFQRMRYQQIRHLFVVDAENEVVGIITRKDLFRFMNHMAGDVNEPQRTTTPVMTHPRFYNKSWVVVHQKPTWLPRDQHRALFGGGGGGGGGEGDGTGNVPEGDVRPGGADGDDDSHAHND